MKKSRHSLSSENYCTQKQCLYQFFCVVEKLEQFFYLVLSSLGCFRSFLETKNFLFHKKIMASSVRKAYVCRDCVRRGRKLSRERAAPLGQNNLASLGLNSPLALRFMLCIKHKAKRFLEAQDLF